VVQTLVHTLMMLSIGEVISSTCIEMLVLYDIVFCLYSPQIQHRTRSVVGVRTAEFDFALLLPSVLMRKRL
jgi:Ca2+/Na+ antiporter